MNSEKRGGQMVKIRARSPDGYLHIATKQGRKQPVRDVAEENRRKQVCLNCTKAKCSGTRECFRRMEARMMDERMMRLCRQQIPIKGMERQGCQNDRCPDSCGVFSDDWEGGHDGF